MELSYAGPCSYRDGLGRLCRCDLYVYRAGYQVYAKGVGTPGIFRHAPPSAKMRWCMNGAGFGGTHSLDPRPYDDRDL